jgi:hypothetical protein
MSQFKNIYYPDLLHDSLRDYFSVNKAGSLSYLYKILLCILWPLQATWDSYDTYRRKTWLISQCKWQMGQLTNVLNYLYDSTNNSIYITQSVLDSVFVPVIAESSSVYATVIAETTTVFVHPITDATRGLPVIIHIPASLYADSTKAADLISTLEKIRPFCLSYTIQTF